MSRLTVNTNDLESEGLDLETVNLEGGNLETDAVVDLEGGDIEVSIGGGGADGVGIQSIEQTVTSTEDGGINEVTQTLTDGTTAVFQIRNGSKGSQGEKGDAGEDWIPTQQELASIAQSAAALVNVPTKVSDLNNDSGFITGYTETDPVFTASAAHGISSSDISSWNAKGTYSKPSGGIPASDIASGVIPTVPSNVSAFTNDSHYVASTAITNIVSLTQAAYDALATKDANTLYIIPES